MRYPFVRLVLALLSFAVTRAYAKGPADSLLRLVPPDAGVTLTIEDLRGHTRDYFASPLAEGLGRLPAVRAWLQSDRFRGFDAATRKLENVLGEKVSTIRDELLGDAVVLTLRVPPGGRQDQARGMLLVRVHNRPLLDRLVNGVNAAQMSKKELMSVAPRTRGKLTYWVREFPPRSRRPAEYYTTLEDNTFAWSNSEELIHGVLDRHAGQRKGLGDEPRFHRVRDRLPARSVASLFVDPSFLEATMQASPKPSKPGDERVLALFSQYVRALDYAGAALEWRPPSGARGAAIILHTEEALDPERLPAWLRHWAGRPSLELKLSRVPSSALGMASLHVDFEALLDVVRALTPSADQHKLDNMLVVLSGLFLGRDPVKDVFPNMGPGLLAYLERTSDEDAGDSLALVAMLDVDRPAADRGTAAALGNALRTLLALYALDPRHGGGQLEVTSQEIRGVKVTGLSDASPFVYALGRGVVALGGSAAALSRALGADRAPAVRFERLRADYFPRAESFVCVDLDALHAFALSHRGWFTEKLVAKHGKSAQEAGRDLDQALALVALFHDAFLTSAMSADARSAHRMLGFLVRGSQAPR